MHHRHDTIPVRCQPVLVGTYWYRYPFPWIAAGQNVDGLGIPLKKSNHLSRQKIFCSFFFDYFSLHANHLKLILAR